MISNVGCVNLYLLRISEYRKTINLIVVIKHSIYSYVSLEI